MTKFLKSFYKSHRIGLSVGKTLLWIWVKNDLPKIRGEIGIDLAGGSMVNKRFFSTKKYICVDIDEKELQTGKARNSDAITINQKIQEFLKKEQAIKPDVLVCLQTMGTNQYFEHEESIEVIKDMYEILNYDGSMLFNITWLKDIDSIQKKLSNFLNNKFKSVEYKFYGSLHTTWKRPLPAFLRLILAYMMHFLPSLRTMFGFKKERIYYLCKNKL
jgi:hypothetical protein